ncbi:MAG: DUF4337 domain-containing protein [Alphaproteobacteria bacterium]|nr:DUF4337 domain-containing protein [Alphaproteobacteria bacterium]
MDAADTGDLMSPEADDRFKKRAAIMIAIMAMLLAITSLGGSNAGQDMINSNIEASNLYAFYQAKTARQTSYELAANDLELTLSRDAGLSAEARAAIQKRIAEYRATMARYDSDSKERDGKKELLERARQAEAARDQASRRGPYFDYAEALLQIAIVLASVAIIAHSVPLLLLGGGLGTLGALLMVNGYTLLMRLPFLE